MPSLDTDRFRIRVFERGAIPGRLAAALVSLRQAKSRERFPDDPQPRAEQQLMELAAPPMAAYEQRFLLAELDGELVGFDEPGVDFEDNPRILWIEPWVQAEHRRKGIGRRLFAAGLEALSKYPIASVGFSIEPHDAIGQQLKERVEAGWGLSTAIVGCKNRLELEAIEPDSTARAIRERLDRVGPDYRSVFFELDHLPSPSTGFELTDFCDMVQEIENLMPLEDLDIEPQRYAPERFQAWADYLRGAGLTMWNYVALEANTGRAVGITNVAFDPVEPRRINQWDTGVRKSAQGRGLGKLLKLQMLAKILAELPGAEFIHTDNAGSNAAMLAVNQSLGFYEHHRSLGYQMPLAELCAKLGVARPS